MYIYACRYLCTCTCISISVSISVCIRFVHVRVCALVGMWLCMCICSWACICICTCICIFIVICMCMRRRVCICIHRYTCTCPYTKFIQIHICMCVYTVCVSIYVCMRVILSTVENVRLYNNPRPLHVSWSFRHEAGKPLSQKVSEYYNKNNARQATAEHHELCPSAPANNMEIPTRNDSSA